MNELRQPTKEPQKPINPKDLSPIIKVHMLGPATDSVIEYPMSIQK